MGKAFRHLHSARGALEFLMSKHTRGRAVLSARRNSRGSARAQAKVYTHLQHLVEPTRPSAH